ncbi:hypothetical protein D3C72_1708380 [compost metagenome]
MRDHHAARGNLGVLLAQLRRDEFVRQAMKAVALDALVEQHAWERVAARCSALAAVKGRVERGRLRQRRCGAPHRMDQSQALQLVQRRERCQCLDGDERVLRNHHRAAERVPAMHDAVARGDEPCARRCVVHPIQGLRDHAGQGIGRCIDRAAGEGACRACVDHEQPELDRRRAGVEGEHHIACHVTIMRRLPRPRCHEWSRSREGLRVEYLRVPRLAHTVPK